MAKPSSEKAAPIKSDRTFSEIFKATTKLHIVCYMGHRYSGGAKFHIAERSRSSAGQESDSFQLLKDQPIRRKFGRALKTWGRVNCESWVTFRIVPKIKLRTLASRRRYPVPDRRLGRARVEFDPCVADIGHPFAFGLRRFDDHNQ